jgi:MGT family glycosyltransferase
LPSTAGASESKKTIVFVEMPAYGHVNPTLPVVHELVRRGADVIYYDAEEFQAQVERAGATFRAYPGGVLTSTDIARATQTGDLLRVPGLILGATESLVPFLLEELPRQQPAAVVLDSNALWGHITARMLHLPTVSLMTTFSPTAAQLRRLSPREWIHMVRPMLPSLPRVVSLRTRLLRRFSRSVVPRPAFPARGGLNIAFFPREFQPDNPGVDDTFRFVGPMIDREVRQGELPFDISGAEPLIYISLGTLHRGSADFFHECFAAFADMQVRVILSVGPQTDMQGLGNIPPNFIVRPFVPQFDVLRRAAVFFTHGGMNSALEGLFCAVPLVVIPQQVEQLLIGLHVADRGAALVLRGHVAGERVSAAQLRGALERVLSEPGFGMAASALQKSLHATGGYRQAADEIQAHVGVRRGAQTLP